MSTSFQPSWRRIGRRTYRHSALCHYRQLAKVSTSCLNRQDINIDISLCETDSMVLGAKLANLAAGILR